MTHLVHRLAASALGAVLLAATGVPAALAGPRPIDPARPAPPAPAGPDLGDQLRWMLNGAGIVLAISAVALAVVLWRRAHSAARRSVPA